LETQRNYNRRRLLNHPRWIELKRRDNLTSENLSAFNITRLCIELGIDPNEAPPLQPDRPVEPDKPVEPVKSGVVFEDEPLPVNPVPFTDDKPKAVEPVTPAANPLDGLTEAEAAVLIAVREANKAAAEKAGLNAAVNEARIIELINEHAPKPSQIAITLANPSSTQKIEGLFHYKVALIASAVNAGLNVMLVGDMGSGKTTLCAQIAKMLNLRFLFTGAVGSEYKLTGFTKPNGEAVMTAFKDAYVNGGLFLFDEVDGSNPNAFLAINAALANGHADFPDGNFARHADFRCIAAANTYGHGQSRTYVGRNQLDAASLDRFVTIMLDYDIGLEAAVLGVARPHDAPRPISVEPRPDSDVATELPLMLSRIRRIRQAINTASVRHGVSPRASFAWAALYKAGWPKDMIDDGVIWKGCNAETRAKIEAAL